MLKAIKFSKFDTVHLHLMQLRWLCVVCCTLQRTDNSYHQYDNYYEEYGSGGWDDNDVYDDYDDDDEYDGAHGEGSGYDDYTGGSAGIIIWLYLHLVIYFYCPHFISVVPCV